MAPPDFRADRRNKTVRNMPDGQQANKQAQHSKEEGNKM